MVLLAGAVVLGPIAHADAQQETPEGQFSSPTRAVAGAPIWVRSVTPCPVRAGAYQYVRVGITAQGEPDKLEYIESTDADLAPDGSWLVTLSAPSDMAKGITKSYEIQVQCIENEAPYAAPSRDPSVTPSTLVPTFSYFRYFYRRLYVTGFGTADATETVVATADTTTTTSTPSTSTSTTALNTTTNDASSDDLTAQAVETSVTTWLSDEAERAAEARSELAAQSLDDDVVLVAEPVAARSRQPSPDGGAPWWSFVAATVLAIGAVIGYGQRRRTTATIR